MSFPYPVTDRPNGDDWEPIESTTVSEILEPFRPDSTTVWKGGSKSDNPGGVDRREQMIDHLFVSVNGIAVAELIFDL